METMNEIAKNSNPRDGVPKLILVCGPWSSGTTAVSGMLEKLGLKGLAPYFQTNDARTKNSYESMAFRESVGRVASEQSVSLKVDRKAAAVEMLAFRDRVMKGDYGFVDPNQTLFLKYPLSGLLIPEICQVFQTRLVYVLRPLKEIEATRSRRGWGANFGEEGAKRIYSIMFDIQVNMPVPTLVLRYPELIARPAPYTRQLAAFCGLDPDNAPIEAAADFIRRPEK